MGNLFNSAISAQRHFILLAARHSKPSDAELQKCLEPQIKAITAVTEFREGSRRSNFFNHLSSVSEAIPGKNHHFKILKIFIISLIVDFNHANPGSPCQRDERRRNVLY